jgi:hypothetical protein
MQIFKLYFQDASSEAAYQASLITRDRALASRQESIDIMKRLISQMEDDPLMTLARQSLEKILQNPDVITDEVFNNIMSKTQEVLDANYDTQVEQFLDTARSRGVTGDTLAIQLSKAKNARAQGMAAAYRDALIARSKEGLTTSLDAINATFTGLNNFFQNKRIATEDLVNAVQSVVPEPFLYSGPPSEAMIGGAGGAGGGGGRTDIPIHDPLAGKTFAEWGVSGPEGGIAGQVPTGPVANAEGATKGTLTTEQIFGQGIIPTGGPNVSTTDTNIAQPNVNPLSPATPESEQLTALQNKIQQTFSGAQAPLNMGGNLTETMVNASKNAINQMLKSSGVSGVSGLVSGAVQAAPTVVQSGGVKPVTYSVTPQGTIQTGKEGGGAYNMATLSGPGLPASGVEMGGGTKEAQRVAGLIGTVNPKTGQIISPTDIIGSTSGGGVRTPASSVGAQSDLVGYEGVVGALEAIAREKPPTSGPDTRFARAKAIQDAWTNRKTTKGQALSDKIKLPGTNTILTSSGTGVRKSA